jgi:hypothetical protein
MTPGFAFFYNAPSYVSVFFGSDDDFQPDGEANNDKLLGIGKDPTGYLTF